MAIDTRKRPLAIRTAKSEPVSPVHSSPQDELLIKAASCKTMDDCKAFAQSSPRLFLQAAPLILAVTAERLSLPHTQPKDVSSTSAWLQALDDLQSSAVSWRTKAPARTLAITLTATRAVSHEIIDVDIVGNRVYALANALPQDWTSEGEVPVVLTASCDLADRPFTALRGSGLADSYGSGGWLEKPTRIFAVAGDHFILVGSRQATNWTTPGASADGRKSRGFQIVVYHAEGPEAEALHDLETPTALAGTSEFDLSTSSVQVCGSSVLAQVKWRDADAVHGPLASNRGAAALSQGYSEVEAIVWCWQSGKIIGRCAFPSPGRYPPIFKLATDRHLVSIVFSDEGAKEMVDWHDFSHGGKRHTPDNDVVSPGSRELRRFEKARPFATTLGLKYLDRDDKVDAKLASCFEGHRAVDRYFARGGLISPDRFIAPAFGAPVPFASDDELQRAIQLKTLNPITAALASLDDFSLGDIYDHSSTLVLRFVCGFRAVFSTRPAERSGLLARRHTGATFASHSRHFVLQTNPDLLTHHLTKNQGGDGKLYRIRSSAPTPSSNANPTLIDDVVRRLNQAKLARGHTVELSTPVLMSPVFSPRSYFGDVSGVASVAEVGAGDAGVTAIGWTELTDPGVVKALNHENVWSDGRVICYADESANHGQGLMHVLVF